MDPQPAEFVLSAPGSPGPGLPPPAPSCSEDDLLRAIDKLGSLGGGFAVIRIGSRQFVRSVPTQLNTDANRLIELAQVGPAGVAVEGREGAVLSRPCSGEAGSEVEVDASTSRSTPGSLCGPTPTQTSTPAPQGLGGYMTLADAVANSGWQEARVRDVLEGMLRDGLVLVDDPPPSSSSGSGSSNRGVGSGGSGSREADRLYWVPALGLEWATQRYLEQQGLGGAATAG